MTLDPFGGIVLDPIKRFSFADERRRAGIQILNLFLKAIGPRYPHVVPASVFELYRLERWSCDGIGHRPFSMAWSYTDRSMPTTLIVLGVGNPQAARDRALLDRLGLRVQGEGAI
jgi:hypothetical protein